MRSRVVGRRHLRTVALVLVAGCLVSFAAGQAASHYALPAPPLASLGARADVPNAVAIGGAISQAKRPTVRHPANHKPTPKPTGTNKSHPQAKAKKAAHSHEKDKPKHKPKPKHRDHQGQHEHHGDKGHHDKKGHHGGNGKADMLSRGEWSADQPTVQAKTARGHQGEGDSPAASRPERRPPESPGGD